MTAEFAQKIKVFKSNFELYHISKEKSIPFTHILYIYSISIKNPPYPTSNAVKNPYQKNAPVRKRLNILHFSAVTGI